MDSLDPSSSTAPHSGTATEAPSVLPAEAPPAAKAVNRASDRLSRSSLGIGLFSVGESTVIPVPMEAVLMPLMLAYPSRAWRLGFAALIGSIIGASLFYFVGQLLYDPVVEPLLRQLSLEAAYEKAVSDVSAEGLFWTVFLISLGPAPLQLATLGAGATGAGFGTFILAIVTSRAIRYLGLALLCHLVGERILRYRIPRWLTILGCLLFLVAFWAVFALFW